MNNLQRYDDVTMDKLNVMYMDYLLDMRIFVFPNQPKLLSVARILVGNRFPSCPENDNVVFHFG